ncbi:2OG-Fe(II) oxygenase [Mucilaginibacter sp.]|uniref:2OG-Fe(II) oxygenase n=1 Tax=Mucilaginibacter sp. TaxID=1882438 RepID=UPI00326653AD
MQQHILTNNIFTIDDFWTPKECEDFIFKSEAMGYEPATVETENGQKVITTVRNNNRVIYKDYQLADVLWQKLKPFVPLQIGYSKAVGLNELFRFYKYQQGQEFKQHTDQSYIRNDVEASYFTFMIYLNENFEGGQTTFNKLTVQPKQGSALVFLHNVEHEGRSVKQGTKYVLRTDIMFRFDEQS